MPLGRRAFLARSIGALLTFSFAWPAQAAKRPAHGHHAPPAHPPPGPPKPRRPVVMIDPGHGGKDPGAIGVSGTYEKRIALAAAQQLKRRLNATGRYQAKLTRERDVFIPLRGRVALAQRNRADLFVSMHADAVGRPAVRGASVYVFASKASDPQSAALALSQNEADRYGGIAPKGYQPEVRQILSSLVVHETHAGSAEMQHLTVASLGGHVRLLTRPARAARFAVLRSQTIPSVLIEMGFMSNRQDERLLKQARQRMLVAQAVSHAIDGYFDAVRAGRVVAG
ncbi:MAG: N-acetylmuramoyl-L-alanine amidase [Proteobacteria bacterium]|nr:N-acetylmuramoyl-L-alanine amidase [Pseudomonadota bacterium]